MRGAGGGSGGGVDGFEVVVEVLEGADGHDALVGADLGVEFFLDGGDEVHHVEAVEAEVGEDFGVGRESVGGDFEGVGEDAVDGLDQFGFGHSCSRDRVEDKWRKTANATEVGV